MINGHTQSIIVYRNPVEQQIWEGGFLFPLMVAMFAALIVAITINFISTKIEYKKRPLSRHQFMGTIIVVASILTVIAVVSLMVV